MYNATKGLRSKNIRILRNVLTMNGGTQKASGQITSNGTKALYAKSV